MSVRGMHLVEAMKSHCMPRILAIGACIVTVEQQVHKSVCARCQELQQLNNNILRHQIDHRQRYEGLSTIHSMHGRPESWGPIDDLFQKGRNT